MVKAVVIKRDELRPFKLKQSALGVILFLAFHNRKRTLIDKVRNKLATTGYRALRALNIKSDGVAVSTASGREFRFDSKNAQFHAIYQYHDRGYEPDVMAVIRVFLPSDGVFVDVGANWGYFSIAIADDQSFHGTVISVEAFQPSFEDLVSVKSQLSLPDSKIATECMALSDDVGEIYLSGTAKIYSGLIKVSDNPTGTKVKKDRLDNLSLERVDVIKLDVEGHELAVLRGALETIRKTRPVIVMESNYSTTETNEAEIGALTFLKNLGYELFIPMLSDEREGRLGLNLKQLTGEALFLRGLRFEPSQRGFFSRRLNVLAIPAGHRFFNDYSLETRECS